MRLSWTLAPAVPALFLLVSPASRGDGNDWPMWRGPNQDLSLETARLGLAGESFHLKVAWKRPLGSGYSAISVSGGTAVIGFSNEESNYFGAFRAATGEELWRVRTKAPGVP